MCILIEKAINIAGTQKKLAEACGVSQAAVSKWLLGGGVSAESAISIERATYGAVRAEDLRPDVFRAFAKSKNSKQIKQRLDLAWNNREKWLSRAKFHMELRGRRGFTGITAFGEGDISARAKKTHGLPDWNSWD